MKKIRFILTAASIAFLMGGCQLANPPQVVTEKPVQEPIPQDDVLESRPEIVKTIDWNTSVSPLVNSLLQSTESYEVKPTLLISDIQNRTANYLASSQVNDAIHALMGSQSIFTIIDKDTINQAKQTLGMRYDDKLISRSKMIALAKSINVDLVLFTTVYTLPTDNTNASITIELLSTQTGEILKRVTSAEINPNQNDQSVDQRVTK